MKHGLKNHFSIIISIMIILNALPLTSVYAFEKTDNYASVGESTTISSISITIDEPKSGQLPSYSIEYPEGIKALDGVASSTRINGIDWYDITDDLIIEPSSVVFKGGHSYRVSFCLEAKEGYSFDNNIKGRNVKINNHISYSCTGIVGYDKTKALYVSYSFYDIEPEYYDLYFAGFQLNEINSDKICKELAQLSDATMERYNSGSMGISYDKSSTTLTLRNTIIDVGRKNTAAAAFGIDGLTVVVEGDCKIISNNAEGIIINNNTTITGSGFLEITGKRCGIAYGKNETNSIQLNIENTSLSASGSGYYGILGGISDPPVNTSLYIINSSVTSEGKTSAIGVIDSIVLEKAQFQSPENAVIKSETALDGSLKMSVYEETSLANKVIIIPNQDDYILGDADGNGEIECVDATFIQRYLAHIETPYTKEKLMRGDVDGSGDLELTDVTAIQYYLCKLKTPYNIGQPI